MPSPDETLHALLVPNYRWAENIAVTSVEIFGGYVLAVVVGIALALVFSWSRWLATPAMNGMPLFLVGQPQHRSPRSRRSADHRLVQVRHRSKMRRSRLPSASFRSCSRQRVACVRSNRELLDLVRTLRGSRWPIVHQDRVPRRPALYLFRYEGRGDPRRRRRDRRRLPRLRPRLGLPDAAGPGHADTAAMFMAVILITLIGSVLYLLVLGSSASSSYATPGCNEHGRPLHPSCWRGKVYRTRAWNSWRFRRPPSTSRTMIWSRWLGRRLRQNHMLKILAGLHSYEFGRSAN